MENNKVLKERFIEIFTQDIKREGADKLLEWLLKSDFFTAPASTRFHGAYEEGLLEHHLDVYNRFDCDNPETKAICALLHDVCKVDFYKPDWKNQKTYSDTGSKSDKGGNFDWQVVQGYSVEDTLPYGHGEKSVYIISGFIKLTREEAIAIRWHMGGFDESVGGEKLALTNAFNMFPLAVKLHIADMQATYLDGRKG